MSEKLTAPEFNDNKKICSKEKNTWYTIADLRTSYILGADTIPAFARRYGLSSDQVYKLVSDGNWDELRIQTSQDAEVLLQEIIDGQAFRALKTEVALQALELQQTEDTVEYLAKYKAIHGDLFSRDPDTGELHTDSAGLPIPLRLPTSPQKIMERKGQNELIQGLKKLVLENPGKPARLTSGKVEILDPKQALEAAKQLK